MNIIDDKKNVSNNSAYHKSVEDIYFDSMDTYDF